MSDKIEIGKKLDEIGEAVLTAISYQFIPYSDIDEVIESIDMILQDPEHLRTCEAYFKSSSRNDVLFYLSNIIYNLKTKSELKLTADVLKWLGSVWKNFIRRNKSYQDLYPLFAEFRNQFKKYYPDESVLVKQINNVHLVKDDFIDDNDPELTALRKLERFYQVISELLSWMKPTYFVLLDYYYERNMKTGVSLSEGEMLEKQGLNAFGREGYTYIEIASIACQTLGILEALYLILKKRKTSRQIITIDGKTKFLTISEIYDFYRDRFNMMKEELVRMKTRG